MRGGQHRQGALGLCSACVVWGIAHRSPQQDLWRNSLEKGGGGRSASSRRGKRNSNDGRGERGEEQRGEGGREDTRTQSHGIKGARRQGTGRRGRGEEEPERRGGRAREEDALPCPEDAAPHIQVKAGNGIGQRTKMSSMMPPLMQARPAGCPVGRGPRCCRSRAMSPRRGWRPVHHACLLPTGLRTSRCPPGGVQHQILALGSDKPVTPGMGMCRLSRLVRIATPRGGISSPAR